MLASLWAQVHALVAAVLFHRSHLAATHFLDAVDGENGGDGGGHADAPPTEAALASAHALPVELLVGLLTMLCSPLALLVTRKEYLVLVAISVRARQPRTLQPNRA